MLDFRIQERVQDDDFFIKQEKNCECCKEANRCLSTAMFLKARLVFNKTMDPTLHYKMKANGR